MVDGLRFYAISRQRSKVWSHFNGHSINLYFVNRSVLFYTVIILKLFTQRFWIKDP